MTLPYDISRCVTEGCKLAHVCRRKEPGRPDGPQVFSAFPGGDDCYAFIDGRETKPRQL